MKLTSTLCLTMILSASALAHAQSMPMEHASMPGMQHGEMASANTTKPDDNPAAVHQTRAVVRALNPAKGSAMLAHEAIPSMHLPAMTMAFVVKDRSLFSKLALGKNIQIEFIKQGRDFVLTAVK